MSCINIKPAIANTIIGSTVAPEFVLRETRNTCFRLLVLCITKEYTGDNLRLNFSWKAWNSVVHDSGSLAISMSVSDKSREGCTLLREGLLTYIPRMQF